MADKDFANYCCDLLSTAGPCVPKRMFGGFGISTEGLTIAIIADLGAGEKLWLKGDGSTRGQYEAAGCAIFTYDMKGVPKSMNYFSAPEAAMDSTDAMRPWAALAHSCALRAHAHKRGGAKQGSAGSLAATRAASAIAPAPSPAPTQGQGQGQLSHTVLERAREVAKKIAASKNLPATKAATPSAKRTTAPAPKTKAARKSAKGASTALQ